MLQNKRILLGITGGIAAYKSVFLLRELQKTGAEVRVTATAAALRFIGRETLLALTKNPVPVEIFAAGSPETNDSWTQHIQWGEWADIFVIAPCSANTLGKIAHGLSDNMLTATVLAARSPILLCPTMDGEMYDAPATKQNLKTVRSFGYHLIEPDKGYLASGLHGKGRLPEIPRIIEDIESILANNIGHPQLLKGKKVVVTGGPTREYIDAVRFISNPSSGKMGLAMAKAASKLGADVIFIHGPIALALPEYLKTVSIESAQELFEAVKIHSDADCIVMAAAVSDFRPVNQAEHKIKKDQAETSLELRENPDILAYLGLHKRKNQTLVGFAMETENLMDNARKKLKSKNVDWIAANSIGSHKSGFASNDNTVTLISHGQEQPFSGPKNTIAIQMLTHIFTG